MLKWTVQDGDDVCALYYENGKDEMTIKLYPDLYNPRKKVYIIAWMNGKIVVHKVCKYEKLACLIDKYAKMVCSINNGSSNIKPFKKFQIRWGEKLGNPLCPYLKRWTFIFFGYSIRIHHWLKSDDKRYFHDHSSNLISIVLKGKYRNVKPIDETKNPSDYVEVNGTLTSNICPFSVEGIFNSFRNFFNMKYSIWKSKATDKHYLDIPKEGAWTLLLEGKPYHKWGFYVNGKKMRPLNYFHKYGIIQDKNYQ